MHSQKRDTLVFQHPAPPVEHKRVWPVFLPFAGCPFRCVYCSQPELTGQNPKPLRAVYSNLEQSLNLAVKKSVHSLGLAFYGGTFTALPNAWPERFLECVQAFKQSGFLTHIRCSTRPDAITVPMLKRLKALGLDMVELGIQSFDEHALTISGRGYTRQQALDACAMVHDAGLELGIQLMPGLPGQTPEAFAQDIQAACAQQAKVARLYPCVVLRGTPLARIHERGGYTPWAQDSVVRELGQGLLQLWKAGTTVIRIGLAPEQDLQNAIIAGPWHPAMGQLVRSRALFLAIVEKCRELGSTPRELHCPERYHSDVLGHKKTMLSEYESLGLSAKQLRFHSSSDFVLLR
ncbi:radical SAM protein [Desulfobaculum bizertense]|uniref:elongator complex protein 3 n=1 Tax=Desulfobaculum bizertense TaxID=376490 RepID=UPI001F3061DA|nr:radical SAM protein [Desulfobaculum bizertense]UIJ37461.1 radical SAM protein [Desulfobaculum bizertense]